MPGPSHSRRRPPLALRRRRIVVAVIVAAALVGLAGAAGLAVTFVNRAPKSALGDRAAATLTPAPSSAIGSTSVAPSVAPSSAAPASVSASASAPAGQGPKVLFGIGAEADVARKTSLVQQAPVKMLSSWYNGPNDLSWMSGWRTGTVPTAYAAGYALHLIVWTGDPETAVNTSYGPACGRAYPLSARFAEDMQQLAQIFGGRADGPPLYVTLFTEFQTYPCVDNAWNPDTATTNYYQALKDQYRAAYAIFHQRAANARVSLGWGGWQASFDDPGRGGGRSLFPHFADVMRSSDFQSFQAMDNTTNVANISSMVSVLGAYGPVMLAHYKPNNGAQATFDADLRAILTDRSLRDLVGRGLFAISLMDKTNVSAEPAAFQFVKAGITAFGRGW